MKDKKTRNGVRYRSTVVIGVAGALIGTVVPGLIAQTGPPSGSRPVQLPLTTRQPSSVSAQQSAPAPSTSSVNVQVQVGGSYAGSVPSGDIALGVLNLTLVDAVQRGLRYNLGALSSTIAEQQADAQRRQVRSVLLPNVGVDVSENAAKVDLAAQGFSASTFGAGALGFAFPSTSGPFHYYDLHGSLQQSVLDVTAIHNVRSQTEFLAATRLQAEQAREEIVLAVTGVYLQLMADVALGERQQAEVAYAEATYKQGRAQVDAGNKAPIEANRSLVELQTEQQRLRSQAGEVQKRQVQLARLLGMPTGMQIHPTEHLEPLKSLTPSLDDSLLRAASQRKDIRAAEALLRSAQQARKAASAERLPTASINGTFGVQGVNPNGGNGVFQASLGISVPVYQGGRISADISSADAVVKQRIADLEDQRGVVEAQVRYAFTDLQVANDRVQLADSNRALGTDTLRQSQDRFSVGVADSVEVVNSEQALATADNDYVSSLFSQHVARISLAHAMGEAQQDITDLFERKAK